MYCYVYSVMYCNNIINIKGIFILVLVFTRLKKMLTVAINY